jgi:pSer/pThr/pTyr-binding forkhead associated (FHA) protein
MIFGETTTAATAYAAEHLPYGKIIVIKRSGQDSASFELVDNSYLFGRSESCDIRIQIPAVSEEHCRVYWDNAVGIAMVQCLSAAGVFVKRNGIDSTVAVGENKSLLSGDVITIVERSFRYETVINMRQKANISPESKSITATPVKFQVQEIRPDIKSPQSSKTTISLGDLKSPSQVISNSPLKQPAVRTPFKQTPISSAFITSPLGMPAERQPIPASPLQQPPSRSTPTKAQTPSKQVQKTPLKTPSTPNNNYFVETVIEETNQPIIVRTPQKVANEFTQIEIVTKELEMSSPKKFQNSSPCKTTVKTPIKTPGKSQFGITPVKIGTSPSNKSVQATPDILQPQASTPVGQIHSLDRITPGRFTPRPLNLDSIIATSSLQVDAEILASPRLSPRVSLIDSATGVHYSPLSPASVLTPEQREAITRELASAEIEKVIGASRPLGLLSPGTVHVQEKDLVDVESPTKSRNSGVQELSLFENNNEEQEQNFQVPEQSDFLSLPQIHSFADSQDTLMEDAPIIFEENQNLNSKLVGVDFQQSFQNEDPLNFQKEEDEKSGEFLVDQRIESLAEEIVAECSAELIECDEIEPVVQKIQIEDIINEDNMNENEIQEAITNTNSISIENIVNEETDFKGTPIKLTKVNPENGVNEINEDKVEEQITTEIQAENEGKENEEHITPRRSSRVRKSIAPLSPSKEFTTPKSAKRSRLSTSFVTLSEEAAVEDEKVSEEAKAEEAAVEEKSDIAETNDIKDTPAGNEGVGLRRSTRAKTPKIAPLSNGRKAASTTSKKRKTVVQAESDIDDNSPLLRRNKSSSNLGSDDTNNAETAVEEDKENKTSEANKQTQTERKKVGDFESAKGAAATTTPHQLRRSTRVTSAKK